MRRMLPLIFAGIATLAAVEPYPVNEHDRALAAQATASLRHCQRTMGKLAAGEAVHILAYGQSITRCGWVPLFEERLRSRFPQARLRIENLAAGGYASQRLLTLAERDLRASYPDLVLFHVYGSHGDYERIMRLIRCHTTAEVAIARDHYGAGTDLSQRETTGWHVFMNERFLPALAEAYHCTLLDVRSPWRRHLVAEGLASQDLLRDKIHLNQAGNVLMAELVDAALQVVEAPDPAASAAWINSSVLGEDVEWIDGVLDLAIDGNRIEIETDGGAATVLIDEQPPSQIPALWLFTRPGAGPLVDWPWDAGAVPLRIDHQRLPVAEEWTLTITGGEAKTGFGFLLAGSRSGFDGSGRNDADFCSQSGRVVIAAGAWHDHALDQKPLHIRPGRTTRFRSYCNGIDEIPAASLGRLVLASGLANGPHRLRLIARDATQPPRIRRVIVHRPPLQDDPWQAPLADRISDRDGVFPMPQDAVNLLPGRPVDQP